jgi:hypothetical protein
MRKRALTSGVGQQKVFARGAVQAAYFGRQRAARVLYQSQGEALLCSSMIGWRPAKDQPHVRERLVSFR